MILLFVLVALLRVGAQNPKIKINGWKVVGDNKEEGFRTITLIIDEYAASSLSKRDWEIYLGPNQVKFLSRTEVTALLCCKLD